MVLDVLREEVARIGEETGAYLSVNVRVVDVFHPEQQAYAEEGQHDGNGKQLGPDEGGSGLLDTLAGELPLYELLVGGVLGYLEEGYAYHAAYDGVWLGEVKARVEHLELAALLPALEAAVCKQSRVRSGTLDHTSGTELVPYFSKAEAFERAIDHHEGYDSGEGHEQGLEGVDVKQSLDSAHHGVEGGNQSEYDDGANYEGEVDLSEDYDRYGNGRDEEP